MSLCCVFFCKYMQLYAWFEITCAACLPQYYTHGQLPPILLPLAWNRYICTACFWIQHSFVFLNAFFWMKVCDKNQIFHLAGSLFHQQHPTIEYYLRLLTLPRTGTPMIIEETGLAPVSQNPITTRRAKSQHGTSPNFVPCLTPGGSQYITQGTRTRSTNPFHRTTACRRKRET